MPINLNGGARTVYAGGLTDYRNQILKEATGDNGVDANAFNANNLAHSINAGQQAEQNKEGTAGQFQKFLQTMGMMAANRGVNKAPMTPAMQNGVMPYDKKLFGLEPKQPVPYQKVILDKQNLNAVLKGYQEVREQVGGPISSDTANMIANVKRGEQMIASSLKKPYQQSIFDGVPKSAAANLYNIGLKNQREGSIYALV